MSTNERRRSAELRAAMKYIRDHGGPVESEGYARLTSAYAEVETLIKAAKTAPKGETHSPTCNCTGWAALVRGGV